MKSSKILRWVVTLVVIALLGYAVYFLCVEKKIKDYSTYCMDSVRHELWEYIGNIHMNEAYCAEWSCIYMWGVSYEWVDYGFSCKVYNKENVELKLDEIYKDSCEWTACNIDENSEPTVEEPEEAQIYTLVWPENWFDEEIQVWKLVLRWEHEDHTDIIFIDQPLWQEYLDPHKMVYWDSVAFKWEITQIDWAAWTHYYNADSIETLEELFNM